VPYIAKQRIHAAHLTASRIPADTVRLRTVCGIETRTAVDVTGFTRRTERTAENAEDIEDSGSRARPTRREAAQVGTVTRRKKRTR
jgi:hypothetical protein